MHGRWEAISSNRYNKSQETEEQIKERAEELNDVGLKNCFQVQLVFIVYVPVYLANLVQMYDNCFRRGDVQRTVSEHF